MSPLPPRGNFRDRRHHLIAVGSELGAPALRVLARRLSRSAPAPAREWRSALIVGHGHIGDVLCQTVSLDALAAGLPLCHLDYLTTGLAGEVLSGNPALRRVLPWNTQPRPDAVSSDDVATLRAERYDAILCTNGFNHQRALLLALKLRIPNRVAFVHRGLSGLVTLPVRLPRPMTPAAQSRIMAEAVTGTRDQSELRPRLYLTPSGRAAADAEWARLGFAAGANVMSCSVTTRQTAGRIPVEFFAAVLRALRALVPDMRVVLAGSSDDASALNALAETLPAPVSVSAGELSLRGFAAFLARCSVSFCMDSGPRHLANAVGTPVVFTRNLAGREAESGQYCPTEVDVMPHGDYLRENEIVAAVASVDPGNVARTILRQIRRPD